MKLFLLTTALPFALAMPQPGIGNPVIMAQREINHQNKVDAAAKKQRAALDKHDVLYDYIRDVQKTKNEWQQNAVDMNHWNKRNAIRAKSGLAACPSWYSVSTKGPDGKFLCGCCNEYTEVPTTLAPTTTLATTIDTII